MRKEYQLDDNLRDGIIKLHKWLQTKEDSDMTNTVTKSIEILTYILIREYYTDKEKELLNELRAQYFRDKKSN
jgi:hypothetical protein